MALNFTKALQKGLAQAEKINSNKSLIELTFDEVNRQIGTVTNNKVIVTLNEPKTLNNLAKFVEIASGQAERNSVADRRRVREAFLAIQRKDTNRIFNIARWTQGANGFPCKIQMGEKIIICDDKASLDKAFEETLEDPFVAAEILKLAEE